MANKLHADIDNVLDGMPKSYSEGPPDPLELQYVNFAIKQLEVLLGEVGRERRLYRRYLGEARAQRRKALRVWCAFNRDENLISRNELKIQL